MMSSRTARIQDQFIVQTMTYQIQYKLDREILLIRSPYSIRYVTIMVVVVMQLRTLS